MQALVRWSPLQLKRLPEFQQDALVVASSVLIGLALYLTGLYPLDTLDDAIPGWIRIALFAAICAVELFRRRAGVVAAAIGLVLVLADAVVGGLNGVSLPMLIVFADLLYAVKRYGTSRLSNVIIVVSLVVTFGAVLISQTLVPDWQVTLLTALAAVPFIIGPVWVATIIRQHQAIAETERTNAAQLAKIAELDRAAAVVDERTRMARDLHDVIASHVSAIAIQSEAALSVDDADMTRAMLTSVRENSVRALDEMRAMIRLLRAHSGDAPETTAPGGLSSLPDLIDSIRASGVNVEAYLRIDGPALPAAVDLTAYRIAQEALTNVMKHAPKARTRVEVSRVDDSLRVDIANDLAAPTRPDDRSDGNGLLNMRERAVALGGTLSAGAGQDRWVVQADLPITGVAG
ncbi:Signal transduction histidine kinase [Prauserella aidingensis]|uniref:sensor histidine kinase n=1 Tax=Prauserella aidingensis TaxID=387890 RepID=UPI0020A36222|nr:histidine kinase [Prauserella aidingensis]MCP2253734.1 Signal transduction histidine kinase [Prauserella aidingensis]